MLDAVTKYREIIPEQQTADKWLDVVLNTGGTQSTLQDIKVSESAGGYSYKYKSDQITNRFVYWRTVQDILELSEVSLDVNLRNNNVRFKFTDSPVLTVGIFETERRILVLVGTVNSIHRFFLPHPHDVAHTDDSILTGISSESAMDPSTFHLLGNTIGHGGVPHKAACCYAEQAYFGYAYANSLYIFQMDCRTGHVSFNELKISQMIPRILSNFSEVLRGKGGVDDSHYVTSITFDLEEEENVLILYALYRDNTLRMWSMKSCNCVSTINCADKNEGYRSQGTQSNALRKASSSSASLMCVFLSYSTCSEFRLIKAIGKGSSNYTMQIVGLIPAPQLDLVDFGISDAKIWGLWCNSEGETSISTYLINFNTTKCWLACSLEPINEKTISALEPGIDPKHMYCSNIFYPGRFQIGTILKALMMFCRSSTYIDANLTLNVLKDRVCQVIEQEVQNEIQQHDLIEEEEYLEISEKFWSKFYSCCEQYQMAANQPIALFMLERSDVICIVKKQMISFLRPCDKFENFVLSGYCTDELIAPSKMRLRNDLETIIKVLQLLEQTITDEIRAEIDVKLHRLQMPNVIVNEILQEQSMMDGSDETFSQEFITTLTQKMQGLHDIPATVISLLDFLRLDQQSETEGEDMELDDYFTGRYLFNGNFGASLITETVRQTSLVRFSLCRNLLILQQILVDNFTLNSTALEVIRSRCIPETVIFLQAYYVMGWISVAATNFSSGPSSKIGGYNSMIVQYNQPATLLHMFVKNRGIQKALKQFYRRKLFDNDSRWMNNLISLANIIQQLIWVVSGTFDFGEWLSNTNQTILIEEYVRLLNSWCEYNSCSRQFILAVSYLRNGESSKALDHFLDCAKGINDESYLKQLISTQKSGKEFSSNEALAQYFLKIIKFFELQSCFDCVITVSEIAIGTVQDPQQLAMFQSILFNNHLYLYHYAEAYNTIHECEPTRRKDCLRQLVNYLFQEKRFDILLEFQYVGLESDLENIIETRARSMQIENNEHYEILFAFHMSKLNMRKASMVMYEKALRYTYESCSIESLEGRHKSLLSCVNTLSLVDKEYRWILKPVIDDEEDESGSSSSGRNTDGEGSGSDEEEEAEEDFKGHSKQDVVVVELADIRKELMLVNAMLIVARTSNESNQVYNMDAAELIILLANDKYYTDATNLAKQFSMPLTSVFKSLTLACIQASDGDFDSWNWIDNNDLSGIVISRNASDILWRFLQRMLDEEGGDDKYNYIKAIAQQVLANDAFLPQWLMDAYKKKNASELIYQFILYGRIEEATELTVEYINAFLGHGTDHFGFQFGKNPSFPIHVVDVLLRELEKSAVKDVNYQENYHQLKQTVTYYLDSLRQSV